ncbi:carboxymuconolactone decarboxylase family protein [Corynebacterium sanguinis]|uniref:Alkylhydroperoxidase AhpD family core domain protein n=1 Tax=Corynebacterium lipophiloflavum (strain ATCC 700352 / DSM 44291 / CCUG 37336 / JCM 10383 / DMMZ 1944) TaxID=525263 RepID=C0XTP7_CORLD|nr:carboxymuconolactone decarboxylase family protein [Corynebacterium lipophiloflavum]EEI16373.1 alkylhydroperoxidase AhpD family core domain protein [Corynebacterium lipophiloflavum DSM 44291]
MNSINLNRTHKTFSASAVALEATARRVDKDTRLTVQLRASFINNCRYCIELHSCEAGKRGWDDNRIALLRDTRPGDWSATDLSDDTVLVLEFTDMGTRLSEIEPHQREVLIQRVVDRFGVNGASDLITAITAINMWNRISVLSGK